MVRKGVYWTERVLEWIQNDVKRPLKVFQQGGLTQLEFHSGMNQAASQSHRIRVVTTY